MSQGILPFSYEAWAETTGMTALEGLPMYLDLAKVMGLSKSIQKYCDKSKEVMFSRKVG